MTTMNIADITHKKKYNNYAPNSYRIFSEDISDASVVMPYANTAPEIYSHPQVLPAQGIEDRNRPHGGRNASFLRENMHTLNEPVAVVNGFNRGLNKEEEKRWWEWNTNAQDDDPNWKQKKRSGSVNQVSANSSASSIGRRGGESGFQTTYQKEHGYLTTDFYRKGGNQNGITRHAMNPNTYQATGIVPITDYKNNVPDIQERVYLDKMSFDHNYNSRDADNYPVRGKRQGAYVLDQIQPKPVRGTTAVQDLNKGTSVWDCMHMDTAALGNIPAKANIHSKAHSAANSESRNQRRDPIGYFDDQSAQQQQQQPPLGPDSKYNPSWTNNNNGYNVNSDVSNNYDINANGGYIPNGSYAPQYGAYPPPEITN